MSSFVQSGKIGFIYSVLTAVDSIICSLNKFVTVCICKSKEAVSVAVDRKECISRSSLVVFGGVVYGSRGNSSSAPSL